MTFHYRYRKVLILSFIIVVVLTLSGIGVYFHFSNSTNKIEKDKLPVLSSVTNEEVEDEKKTSEEVKLYYVDIKGHVVTPGLYQLEQGSRVMDAIMKAGGVLETGDTSVINLGKKITDEMVIVIYSKEEVQNFTKVKEQEQIRLEECKKQNDIQNNACVSFEQEEQEVNSKISLNEASIEELQTLPGIGESKAKDIIEYRETNGKFETIEDIQNVSGIGEKLFAKIKDYITI